MRIPDSVITEISRKLSIVDIVSGYVSLQNKGARWLGLCPFHNEKTPSFNVNEDKNAYYCFGCGKGGSLFNFIMEIESLSFVEAVRFLAEKAHVELQLEGKDQEYYRNKDAKIELYKRVTGSFQYILNNSPKAQSVKKYLSDRGINEEMIELFQLGFAPSDRSWLYHFLIKKNYSSDFLAESGLFSRKYPRITLFSNRLMFPIFNTYGQVIAFSGRVMGDNGPKYINSPDSDIYHKKQLLYGIHQAVKSIKKQRCFYLCEGNVDVVALHQTGVTNAVAPLGTSFTEEQAKLLKRYADSGVIVFDSDNAGKAATEKAGHILERCGIDVEVVILPEKSDPADILCQEGPEKLKNHIKNTVSFLDFLLTYKLEADSVISIQTKQQIIEDLAPYLDSVSSIIKRDHAIGKIAEVLHIEKKSIVEEYNSLGSRRADTKKAKAGVSARNAVSEDLFILIGAVLHRSYFYLIKDQLTEFDFEDLQARNLFNVLVSFEELNNISLDVILQEIQDESLKRLIVEKSVSGEFAVNTEDIFLESIKSFLMKRLRKKSAFIKSAIQHGEKERKSDKEMEELLFEKKRIDEEIEKLKGDL